MNSRYWMTLLFFVALLGLALAELPTREGPICRPLCQPGKPRPCDAEGTCKAGDICCWDSCLEEPVCRIYKTFPKGGIHPHS